MAKIAPKNDKLHFEWPNQNSKTTFIVQTFPAQFSDNQSFEEKNWHAPSLAASKTLITNNKCNKRS